MSQVHPAHCMPVAFSYKGRLVKTKKFGQVLIFLPLFETSPLT